MESEIFTEVIDHGMFACGRSFAYAATTNTAAKASRASKRMTRARPAPARELSLMLLAEELIEELLQDGPRNRSGRRRVRLALVVNAERGRVLHGDLMP